ncbi:uncharacterized protein PV09_05883 [Verruconis gallopava]|uniref:Chaperone/heat shock protein Hsp12 n=1 Tax=Verruconis gallopava TaxID=253628 RepID=A0A0D1XKH1_9PEZI|nr:uncharacterized protein PV09_05883 [Verruconis gallopava]KIW02826.1 hypothetical protein PV09_05883 [Verruconis gallopava]
MCIYKQGANLGKEKYRPHCQTFYRKKQVSISNNSPNNMSDAGRKDFTDKAQEKLTPESQKSTTDKLSEGATDIGDKVARNVQPEQDKSTTQSIGDTLSGNKDHATSGGTGGGIIDKTKETLGMKK